MLFDIGSTITFNFNIYEKIHLLKCCINSFVKRFSLPPLKPLLIHGNPNLNKLESTQPENASTEVSLSWPMVFTLLSPFLHDFNKIEFSLPKYVSTQLPTYQTKLFLKRKDL